MSLSNNGCALLWRVSFSAWKRTSLISLATPSADPRRTIKLYMGARVGAAVSASYDIGSRPYNQTFKNQFFDHMLKINKQISILLITTNNHNSFNKSTILPEDKTPAAMYHSHGDLFWNYVGQKRACRGP